MMLQKIRKESHCHTETTERVKRFGLHRFIVCKVSFKSICQILAQVGIGVVLTPCQALFLLFPKLKDDFNFEPNGDLVTQISR